MQDFGKDLDTVYQSTQVEANNQFDDEEEMELATPGKRILAYLLNCLIGLIAYIPLIWGAMSMYGGSMSAIESGTAVPEPSGFALGLIGLGSILILAYLVFQAVLMSKTGQSLGKRIMKIKVVNEDGDNPGFVGTVLMREVVPNIALTVIGLIPFLGGIVQIGFWIACLVMLFLVDRDRRTLQDMIAKTYVVDAE